MNIQFGFLVSGDVSSGVNGFMLGVKTPRYAIGTWITHSLIFRLRVRSVDLCEAFVLPPRRAPEPSRESYGRDSESIEPFEETLVWLTPRLALPRLFGRQQLALRRLDDRVVGYCSQLRARNLPIGDLAQLVGPTRCRVGHRNYKRARADELTRAERVVGGNGIGGDHSRRSVCS